VTYAAVEKSDRLSADLEPSVGTLISLEDILIVKMSIRNQALKKVI